MVKKATFSAKDAEGLKSNLGASVEEQEEKTRRAIAGAKAKAQGDGFEAEIEYYNASIYRNGRIAHITRQTPKMRAVKRAGLLAYVPVRDPLYEDGNTDDAFIYKPCDFSFVMNSGRPGIFDTKTTNKDVFYWPTKQIHQLSEMRSLVNRTGGKAVAFALVRWVTDGSTTVNLVQQIEGNAVRKEHGLPVDGVDWLTTIEKYLRSK